METKPKRGRRKMGDIPTVDNLIATSRNPIDCEDYLLAIMRDPEAGVDRRDAAAKVLLRAKLQRENVRTMRVSQKLGRKEALDEAANMLTSKDKGGAWSNILN